MSIAFWTSKKKRVPNPKNRPRIFAHRGANQIYPENTLQAFTTALSLGARFLECDLMLSKDKQILIFHDDTLLRMTGYDPRPTKNILAKELTTPMLLAKIKNQKFQIPTLREFLTTVALFKQSEAKSSPIVLNLEIKSSCFSEQKVAEWLLREIGAEIKHSHFPMGNILISSFDWRFLTLAFKLIPQTQRGLLIHKKIPTISALRNLLQKYRLTSIHPSVRAILFSFPTLFRQVCKQCQQQNVAIIPYTINGKILRWYLMRILKVDGFFTDRHDFYNYR